MFSVRNPRILLVIAVLLAALLGIGLMLNPPNILAALAESGIDSLPLTASRAWVTTYDDAGGLVDLTTVTCGAEPGYQTALSPEVGIVADYYNNSYVLNWRPNDLGQDMQLCGLRVAYSLPMGDGTFDPSFSYYHVAGSALRPRDSSSEWSIDISGGCLYATNGDPDNVFNINLDIPDGSRIDYLRIYCYREATIYLPLIMR